ncbi:MAG: glycosyltransferase [Coleofasciculaceae cyanobacterium]
MLKLVSVIIPCYNAQEWIAEAIDSCLRQTYPRVEIIVIDDGSTDASLEIIKSYGEKLIWETGSNRGGNYARNKGLVLAKGEYIQYLDADDYLLPEKIEKQVTCLEETGADIVYGDWRHQRHLPDGSIVLEEIQTCGPKEDMLESLLSNERWVAPVALLFTRAIIDNSEKWDESLEAGQDRDFLITAAINNAKFAYQASCHSIYRRYSNTTVSTASKVRWIENHCLVVGKAEKQLSQLGRFSSKYRQALAQFYYDLARLYLYREYPRKIDGLSYSKYVQFLEKTLRLFPDFKADNGILFNLLQKGLGFRSAEKFTVFLKKNIVSMIRDILYSTGSSSQESSIPDI